MDKRTKVARALARADGEAHVFYPSTVRNGYLPSVRERYFSLADAAMGALLAEQVKRDRHNAKRRRR